MSTLQENLDAIKLDKDTNLKPENLKKDVTCLGVTGTYEGSGGTVEGVKQFATIEEMNNSTDNKEGDLALVYKDNSHGLIDTDEFNLIMFPESVTLPEQITSSISISCNYVDTTKHGMFNYNITSTSVSIICYWSSLDGIKIKYTSEDGIHYTRTTMTNRAGDNITNPVELDDYYCVDTDSYNSVGQYFLIVCDFEFNGNYKYTNDKWEILPTQLNAMQSDVLFNKKYYGKDGVNVGTLTENVSSEFSDTSASVYAEVSNIYNSIDPVNYATGDLPDDIYCIPVNQNLEPLINTVGRTDGTYLFSHANRLKYLPKIDTSSITNAEYMFLYCDSLVSIAQIDTHNITDMATMFKGCEELVTVPILSTSSVTAINGMFTGCTKLSDESLNNILQMCVNATSYTGTKTLAILGLTEEQAIKCTTLSNYSVFTAAGWTTGY